MRAGLTADGVADLLGHVSDLVNRIRQEVVCFQEVKGADRQQLKGDAHVSTEMEPAQHLHAVADGRRADEAEQVAQERRSALSPTHCLWSGSVSPILSSTFISSLAASLYFSTFLMIFRATPDPPLREKTRFKWVFLLIGSNFDTHLLWSKHFTTFPKVPSPKVSTISSEKQMELKLEPSRRSRQQQLK